MFQDSPIYDRLVAERGDIPSQVRREAERVNQELEYALRPLRTPGASPLGEMPPLPRQAPRPQQQWQRPALPGAGPQG